MALANDLPNFFDLNLKMKKFGNEIVTIKSINISYTCDNEAIHNNVKGITLVSKVINGINFYKADVISTVEDEEGIHINANVSSTEKYVIFKDGVALTNVFDSSMITGTTTIFLKKDGTVTVTALPAEA